MFKNYLIIGCRYLWKQKLSTFINVVGLAIGITCALVLSSFAIYELSFDREYPLSNNTYRVVEKEQFDETTKFHNTTAYPLAAALRQEMPQLKYVTQIHGPVSGVISISGISTPHLFEEHQLLFVDSVFQIVFDLSWIDGQKTDALINLQSVVLTQSLAKKYYPEAIKKGQSVVGRSLEITVAGEFKEVFTVTGVVEDPPANTSYRYSMLLPYSYYEQVDPYATSNWSGNYQGTTFVTLTSAQDPQEVEHLLTEFKSKYLSTEDDRRKNYYLQPLVSIHTDETYGSAPGSYVIAKKYLVMLLVLGFLILVLAAANYVSLTSAQIFHRSKEIGVRGVIGSTRAQLISQFLVESLVVTLLAVMLSLVLTPYLLSRLNELLVIIDLSLSFDNSAWLITLLLILLVTLMAGVYPAVMASRIDARSLSKVGLALNLGSSSKVPLKKTLLALQFTICQILVAATLTVAWQMSYISKKELGFDQEEIITVPIPEYDLDRLESLKSRWKQHSSIYNVTFSTGVPTSHNLRLGTTFRLRGASENHSIPAEMKVVDEEYIETYDLKLIAGEGITPMDKTGNFTGFVVNETLVKSLGLTSDQAIGKQLEINEGRSEIRGVVADFQNSSLKEDISPCLLFNWYPDFLWEAGIKISPTNHTATLDYVKKTWLEYFPQSVYSFQFLEQYLNTIYALEQLLLLFVKVAAVLAVLMGCMGLYGLVSISAVQRTKEIGLRKVLGASATSILAIFTSEYIWIIAISFVIATPISWLLLNNWLNGFAYRIDIGIGLFLITFSILIIVALGAISSRLVKVVITNPVESLRNE